MNITLHNNKLFKYLIYIQRSMGCEGSIWVDTPDTFTSIRAAQAHILPNYVYLCL